MHHQLVSCSLWRTKKIHKSSAKAKYTQMCNRSAQPTKVDGLVYIIVDNFDASLSSPNGLMPTHDMATIETHPSSSRRKNLHSGMLHHIGPASFNVARVQVWKNKIKRKSIESYTLWMRCAVFMRRWKGYETLGTLGILGSGHLGACHLCYYRFYFFCEV